MNINFESLLHPRVLEHCKKLYVDEHYKHAALEAMTQVELALKEKSEVKDKFGVNLVTNLFGDGKGNSEHEFLRQRLELVEENLANPDGDYIYAGDGRVSRRTRPESRRDTKAHQEARLLQKLLAQAREGQVLAALKNWRGQFGEFLREHRQGYEEMQQAYDEWWKLPPYRQETIPKPPKPPPQIHR